jgi:hypothetical protein
VRQAEEGLEPGACACGEILPPKASCLATPVRVSYKSEFSLPEGIPRVRKYYAIKRGYRRGIFFSWEDCERYVKGYSGSEFKSFKSYSEVVRYLG